MRSGSEVLWSNWAASGHSLQVRAKQATTLEADIQTNRYHVSLFGPEGGFEPFAGMKTTLLLELLTNTVSVLKDQGVSTFHSGTRPS